MCIRDSICIKVLLSQIDNGSARLKSTKALLMERGNVDSQCHAACLSTTAFSNGSSWLSNSTDVIKNRCASILNAKAMCARSTVVDNGQVFVVLFTREVVTRSVVY